MTKLSGCEQSNALPVRRFRVVAGPVPGADSPLAQEQLCSALARIGVTHLRSSTDPNKQYSFDMEASTVEDALATVTRVLRSVYGMQWWADVMQLSDGTQNVADQAHLARWN